MNKSAGCRSDLTELNFAIVCLRRSFQSIGPAQNLTLLREQSRILNDCVKILHSSKLPIGSAALETVLPVFWAYSFAGVQQVRLFDQLYPTPIGAVSEADGSRRTTGADSGGYNYSKEYDAETHDDSSALSASDVSDTEAVDGDNFQQNVALTLERHIRSAALQCLLAIFKRNSSSGDFVDKRAVFAFWTTFLAEPTGRSTESANVPQGQNLQTIALTDRSFKCRRLALQVLAAFLEHSRPFLAIAQDPTAERHGSFTSVQDAITKLTYDLHKWTIKLLNGDANETNESVFCHALKLLTVLVANTPYHRLSNDLLQQLIGDAALPYMDSSEGYVKLAAIQCLETSIRVNARFASLIADVLVKERDKTAGASFFRKLESSMFGGQGEQVGTYVSQMLLLATLCRHCLHSVVWPLDAWSFVENVICQFIGHETLKLKVHAYILLEGLSFGALKWSTEPADYALQLETIDFHRQLLRGEHTQSNPAVRTRLLHLYLRLEPVLLNDLGGQIASVQSQVCNALGFCGDDVFHRLHQSRLVPAIGFCVANVKDSARAASHCLALLSFYESFRNANSADFFRQTIAACLAGCRMFPKAVRSKVLWSLSVVLESLADANKADLLGDDFIRSTLDGINQLMGGLRYHAIRCAGVLISAVKCPQQMDRLAPEAERTINLLTSLMSDNDYHMAVNATYSCSFICSNRAFPESLCEKAIETSLTVLTASESADRDANGQPTLAFWKLRVALSALWLSYMTTRRSQTTDQVLSKAMARSCTLNATDQRANVAGRLDEPVLTSATKMWTELVQLSCDARFIRDKDKLAANLNLILPLELTVGSVE